MASSREVFEMRREGKLCEAFEMASWLIEHESNADWNAKAYAYCLNDLIKKAVSANDYLLSQSYSKKFSLIILDQQDEILIKTVKNAKLIANPEWKNALEAKQLSYEEKDKEALPLFKSALLKFPTDKELYKYYGWSLYKTLKKSIETNDKLLSKELLAEYYVIEQKIEDGKLIQAMIYLKYMADEEKQIIRDAKEYSKSGNHQEALSLFRQAIKKFPDDIDLNEQYGWELHKEGKIIFECEKIDTFKARTLLAEYIRLKNERPSQLHSLFLRLADKITDREEFNLISFLKLWDLKNLRPEDFENFIKDDKIYPSIAEKVIQHGAKLILEKKLTMEVATFLAYIDLGIKKFQENIWLTYYKAKLLYLIGQNEQAIQFLLPVVKEKISDFWTWSLLAELFSEVDKKRSISCYCKSLLCKSEEIFLTNVRLKFIEILINEGLWKEAKVEINIVIQTKLTEAKGIPEKISMYQTREWYKSTLAEKNNFEFYYSQKHNAEEFVFHSLPWFDAYIGESFTIPDKPNKPRRKLFIKLTEEVIEIVISDKKFGNLT